ncbi:MULTISPECIES: D-alanine--D-alanine ligase family protein [Romboutsia]|uniref:D-alanine--D-alanine ligase n=1 Tax=Romboutsia hominis TaxID=1507512 RepID=A0A2P2BV65_9FIRM|nr:MULTISPECIES: D-alanine--D-alanine ligase family protein [Romboutsia]MDB8790491.1 D-alanine--D-alanine ligase [Romboutsia sp. 1001216sp1]MDB8802797.1 D-alanine--D-alanine ligase [Romboutsia sp. 1001216sp1]MDB8805821.1 D-alanine--D-alanine ligase [Romboutsia sp. 1001216sp1]MDB8808851.1 D-alanine--D-alanine ligase [Romboutsia sp. 1001216sp1]MDB8811574.1 D-alanine--D-alanine ligase [Romboutsia sp. 1001216sp1]
MSKLNVALIFGGKSGEHEVSLSSTASIYKHIDKNKYNVFTIGITKDGRWMYYEGSEENIKNGQWENLANKNVEINLIPVGNREVGIKFEDGRFEKIDVLFPVLHGPYGEDGKIQGLFEISQIPYVGCGVLASSVGMDKLVCKKVFSQMGLPQVNYTYTTKIVFNNNTEEELNKIERELDYPVFVKPANLGSSVGISKATNRKELLNGINEALKFDSRIVLEQGVDAREIEVSVLGNEEVKASIAGEIKPAKDFYDYEDKYINGASTYEIPAKISDADMENIRKMAVDAFKGIDGKGLSRVDFFIDRKSGEIFINEINTLPGFTNISMYPKMWEVTGLEYSNLIDKLIELAIDSKK